jgi:hypothetical protein
LYPRVSSNYPPFAQLLQYLLQPISAAPNICCTQYLLHPAPLQRKPASLHPTSSPSNIRSIQHSLCPTFTHWLESPHLTSTALDIHCTQHPSHSPYSLKDLTVQHAVVFDVENTRGSTHLRTCGWSLWSSR